MISDKSFALDGRAPLAQTTERLLLRASGKAALTGLAVSELSKESQYVLQSIE